MFNFARFVCVLLAVVVTKGDDKMKDKQVMPPVKIDVYYESLCPDSIKFITKQLYPTYEKLGKFMDITLLPYGKAKQLTSENQTVRFDCHHGERECEGNKVQACALKHLAADKDKMEFVNCVMDKVEPKNDGATYPGEKCAKKLELSYDQIKTCANTTEGDTELVMLGDKTDRLMKPLKNVPTIVFKSAFKEADQAMAVKDFRQAVCSYIGGNKEHPKECKSAATANQAAILTAILAAIFLKIVS